MTLDDLRHLPAKEQAGQVNARVNRAVRYRPEVGPDHWQTPEETFELGFGDCEDFAIAKMACLLRLGWSEDDLRLVYCKQGYGPQRQAHLVLAATIDGDEWVLDSLGHLINEWANRPDLTPLFSFNRKGVWARGRKTDANPLERLGQWAQVVDQSREI